jgi:HK97 family phage prohead protease
MPYFITNSSPDCSGWATIKEDGEVMGCHATKQDAIDQMVAISVAEKIQPGGERALFFELEVGDYVSWNLQNGIARGEILQIERNGQIKIPDFDAIVIGSQLNPAALIEVYENDGAGWKDTGIFVAFNFSQLTKIDELPEVEMEDEIDLEDDTEIDDEMQRVLPDNYRPSLSEDVPNGRACGNCLFYKEDDVKEFENGELRAWCEKWDDYVNGAYYCNAWQPAQEERAEPNSLNIGDFVSWNTSGGRSQGKIERIERDGQINVPNSSFTIQGTPDDPAALIVVYRETEDGYEPSDVKVGHKFSTLTKISNLRTLEIRQVNLTPPAYMRAAARRGLELNRQGFGGDGLTDKTKQEARDMAAGRVSEDKWRRIAPWIARHLVDLDAPQNSNTSDPGYPGPGLVAHLLWGSSGTKRGAQRTLDYAQGVVDRLDAEEQQSRWSSVNVKLNKEKKENNVTKVERRVKTDIDFELRIDNAQADGMRFTGYAAVFNSDSEPLPFIERIMPGAFKRSLKSRNEVKLFKNHNMDEVLASTRSKTLKLTEDSTGLLAEATLPDTTAGRDLAVLMKRGDVHAMSFGFSVPAKGDRWSNDGMTRELHQIRLHEVSIVTGFPAYEATTASVRSLDILASRTNVDADALADAMIKLEAGEKLADSQADLLQEVVTKLRVNEPNQDDLLELKRKQLDLLLKMV